MGFESGVDARRMLVDLKDRPAKFGLLRCLWTAQLLRSGSEICGKTVSVRWRCDGRAAALPWASAKTLTAPLKGPRDLVSADGRRSVSVAVEDMSPAGPIRPPAPQETPLLGLELDVHRAAAVTITPTEVTRARSRLAKLTQCTVERHRVLDVIPPDQTTVGTKGEGGDHVLDPRPVQHGATPRPDRMGITYTERRGLAGGRDCTGDQRQQDHQTSRSGRGHSISSITAGHPVCPDARAGSVAHSLSPAVGAV